MMRVRSTLAFTAVVLRQLVRDRTALFFVLVLPVAIMVIIGTTFGGEARIEVALWRAGDSELSRSIESSLREADGLRVRSPSDRGDAVRAVRRRQVAVAVLVPADLEQAIRSGGSASVELLFATGDDGVVTASRIVEGVLAAVDARLTAAQVVRDASDGAYDQLLAPADGTAAVAVTVTDVGATRSGPTSRFSTTAPQNLVLFVFVNSMATAALLVKAKRSGVLRRSLATPTSVSALVLGMGLGWFVFAILQSAIILTVGRVLFDVRWGDPIAASLLVVAFAAVGCGAGLLVGAVGQDEDRASSVTPILGMVLGGLGGCMVPLEVFPPSMVQVARLTPHYWAVVGWEALIFEGAGVGDIWRSLAVLGAIAVASLTAATLILRRRLTG
jgi:ABC-2 type transport system permease protein